MPAISTGSISKMAFIGFGEAAQAFIEGLGPKWAGLSWAFDIKTGHEQAAVSDGKWADYHRAGVTGCVSSADALSQADIIFSLVTADQALVAAEDAAAHISAGALYLDCNSCSPGAKRRAAAIIDQAGGRYVDVAVVAPVRPLLHKAPVLISGPHVSAAEDVLSLLGMNGKIAGEAVGEASSIKMVRSIMMKGLEALFLECVLAGRRAGVEETVLASLDVTFPGFDFKDKAPYMMERAMKHGLRRAAEMREVAITVEELGLPGRMAEATSEWQQEIGDLGLAADQGNYAEMADALLNRLISEEDAA